MKHGKIIRDFIIILAALVLFCSWYEHGQRASVQTSEEANQYNKIYLITMDKEVQYWYYINQGAKDMAKFLGVTYQWDAPAIRNTDTQIELLNKAVNDGANAILLAAIDARKLAAPVEDAKARGVKIIYVDSPANEEAVITLATDNVEAGKVAGRTMIEELEALGRTSGKIGIVGINTASDNTMKRENGFRDVIVEDGRFTMLNTEYGNTDLTLSQAAADLLIQNNPDLVGIFGTDEISSVGVGNAIKSVQNKVVGIGFDKSDATLKLMEDGSLKAIVVQNPYTMGYLGMAEAVAAIKGYDTGPASMNTGASVLRKR